MNLIRLSLSALLLAASAVSAGVPRVPSAKPPVAGAKAAVARPVGRRPVSRIPAASPAAAPAPQALVGRLGQADERIQDAARQRDQKAIERELAGLFETGSSKGSAQPPTGFAKGPQPAPEPWERRHAVSLADHAGKPFLQTMLAKDGIKAAFDKDFLAQYTMPAWTEVKAALKHFDGKIAWKIRKELPEAQLKKVVDSLAGQTFTPKSAVPIVGKQVKGRAVFDVAQLLALTAGAGTLVRVDDANYYYNYGYKSGESPDDVKSGRSFGAGPTHKANDASDVFYLNELEEYMKQTEDARPFYRALMEILTRTDASGYAELSPLGQTVATDFTAIYTAESVRHIMVDLVPYKHPWENDLAEVTFLAAFGTAVGKVMIDGQFRPGVPREYWAMSKISNRSGIGQTRKDRRKLQRLLSGYARRNYPEVVAAIEEAIGGPGPKGDVFQGMMEFLNDAKTQKRVKANAGKLTDAFVELLGLLRRDAGEIAAEIEAKPLASAWRSVPLELLAAGAGPYSYRTA